MDTFSVRNDGREVAPAFDPNDFKQGPGPAGGAAGAGVGPDPAVEVVPWPSPVIASAFARVASLGLEDEVEKFQREYAADLTLLFDHLEVPDALAEYGIVMSGGAGPAPAWARLLQAGGMASAMLLMRRPVLLARLLEALGISKARGGARDRGNDEPAGEPFDPFDGVDGAADGGGVGMGGERAAA